MGRDDGGVLIAVLQYDDDGVMCGSPSRDGGAAPGERDEQTRNLREARDAIRLYDLQIR